MASLCDKIYFLLSQYEYLQPFLRPFNNIQFSINGNNGFSDDNPCQDIQTGIHTDITYSYSEKKGIYCSPTLNSQEINSLVVIITVGHSRVMALERVVWAPGEKQHGMVLETKYLVLTHNSCFILHPLDERPSLRDAGSKELSYWRHGRVRLMCTNTECKTRCNKTCNTKNDGICSLMLGLRTCSHSRTIDASSWTEPMDYNTRCELKLPSLSDLEEEKNSIASDMLEVYVSSGDQSNFITWVGTAVDRIKREFLEDNNVI